ncbi:hypothetical protein CGRA01v4_03641 [Colletotrichum graminicola]|nr:hypothetical protein CGRA01v4_03641 [Colletotrichum graminicola]
MARTRLCFPSPSPSRNPHPSLSCSLHPSPSQPALGSCSLSQKISRYQQCSSQRIPFNL